MPKFAVLSKVCGYFLIFIAYLLLVIVQNLQAQNQPISADKQFSIARETAFNNGNYDEARRIAYLALESSPDYQGIRIFIARLYGWEGKYVESRLELEKVLQNDPDNRSAYKELISIESRSGNIEQALLVSDRALNQFPQDEEFLLQTADVLFSYEKFDRSEQFYQSVLVINPSNIEARDGMESARLMQMKNSVSLSYRHDQFSEIFDSWNFLEMQLSRQTKYGSVIGRLEYANRFSTNGVQFNLDAYPLIASGFYAYINAGYSGSSIYPGFRFGTSLYKSIPRAFEVEGGFRYLNFSNSETYIYTVSLTKYRGSYMFTGRTFLVPSSSGNLFSGNVMVRRYLGNARSYIGLAGGYGASSGDIQFAEEVNILNSRSITVDGQYPINDRILFSGIAGFDSEEFRNFTRDRFSFKVGLSYRF